YAIHVLRTSLLVMAFIAGFSSVQSVMAQQNLTARLLFTLPHNDVVRCVAFSPDGKRILTGCDYRDTGRGDPDGTAKGWDATTGREIFTIKKPNYAPVVSPLLCYSTLVCAFSPDGKRILLVDSRARVVDAASGQELYRLDISMTAAFSP